jgi:hypothetical protein
MTHGHAADADDLRVGFGIAAPEPDGRPNPRPAIPILYHNHEPLRHLSPSGKTDDHPVDSMYRTSPSAHSAGFDRSSRGPSSCSSGTLDLPGPPFTRKGPAAPANPPGRRSGVPATFAQIQRNAPLPPTSFTSSYDDPDPRSLAWPVASDDRSAWEKLAEQRSRIRSLLDDIRRKRSRHQDLQLQKDQVDRELYLAVRRQLFHPDPVALEKCVGASERATLEYQDAGAKLHQVLEDLDDAELEVDILENRVYYKHIRGNLRSPFTEDDEDSDHEYQPPSRMSLRGISHDKSGEDLHPLYQRMRDAFGELQLSREYLHNLTLKYSVVVSQDRSQLPQDTLDFLDSFEDITRRARADIDNRTDMFERLKSTCQGRRLIPQTSPFYGDDNTAITVLGEDISLNGEDSEDAEDATSLAHPVYPILLSNPKHLLQDPWPLTSKEALKMAISQPEYMPYRSRQVAEAMQEHGIGTLLQDAKSEDKNDFVNRWLLQKLRLSPMEALVLHSTCSTVLRVLDVDRWQRDVLQFWPRDGAVTTPEAEDDARNDPLEVVSDKRTEPRSEPVSRAVSAPERL